jgi:hypothetical protein
MVLLTYVDDCIIIGLYKASIDCFITSIQTVPENFKLTDKGDVNKFLGIEITKLGPDSFELLQPFLINRLLQFLGLCNNAFATDANPSSTPVAKGLLHQDLAGKPRKYSWKYWTLKSTRNPRLVSNSSNTTLAASVSRGQPAFASLLPSPTLPLPPPCMRRESDPTVGALAACT